MSSRTTRRRGTKTKAIAIGGGKSSNAQKSRNSRTWKKSGVYQQTSENPLYRKVIKGKITE